MNNPARRVKRPSAKYKFVRTLVEISLLLVACLIVYGVCAYFVSQVPETKYEEVSAEVIALALQSNEDVEPESQKVIDAGLSLIGKVGYFWGGKSFVTGFDPEWGTKKTVDSSGSETSGTQRPFGLDCSGFVCWTYAQLGYTKNEIIDIIGTGTENQWNRSTEISWSDLRPGDFVFQNRVPSRDGNHIGICIGFGEDGMPLFVHCAYSFNNVVVTQAGDVFRYARRPQSMQEVLGR